MRPWNIQIALAPIVMSIVCSTALGGGGPPLIGDDPGTPGDGHWEINIAYPYLRTPNQITMETPHLDLNYGLGDHLQLKCEAGYMIGKNDDQHWIKGADDPLVGVKWRFLDDDKSGIDMSVYPQIGFNTSRALARGGFVNTGTSAFIPVEIGKSFGKIEFDAEAGFQYVQHGHDQWVAGLIVGYQLTERVELLGEVRAVLDDDFRRNTVIFDAGARVQLLDHVALIFAAGRGIRTTYDIPTLQAYAGFQFTF